MAKSGPLAKAKRLTDKSARDDRRADLRPWVKTDGREPHQKVFENWKRLGTRSRNRRMQDLYFACLYDDAELATAVGGLNVIGEFTPQTLCANVCRRQVDTFVAKIAKNRPLPMGLTTAGNYSQQRQAKALSQFFAGVLDEVKFWPTRTLRLRDAGIFGSGMALNWRNGRKIVHDRAFPFEFRVSPRDARYGRPRTLYMGRYVDRLVLQEMCDDKFKAEIDEAESRDEADPWQLGLDETNDDVLVIDMWHLRSGEDAKDGWHVRAISNATLAQDPYERDYFPASKFDFSPPVFGYWGEGLIKQLAGLQFEINSVGLRLQERHYLMGTYVLREATSDVDYESIDNGTLTEVVWSGKKPEFVNPPAAHPGLLEWFREMRGSLPSEITGQSNYTTRGEIPKGMEQASGRAQRVYLDTENTGFAPQGRADEQDVIDTCWQFFDLAEEIYEETGKAPSSDNDREKGDREVYTVRVEDRQHGRSVLTDLSYDKVRLDREKFTLRVFPTNFLQGTPEDRFATAKEIVDAGFLSEDEALTLLDFPDVQHTLNLRTAARRIVERLLDKLKDSSNPAADYEYPEPAYNLDLCIALGQQNYLEARLDGVPEKNCKWILQFAIDAAMTRANKPLGARPDGSPPPGGPPPGPNVPPDVAAGGPPPPGVVPAPQQPLPAGVAPPETMAAIPPGA